MVRSVGLGICAGLMVLACGPIVQAQPVATPIAQEQSDRDKTVDPYAVLKQGWRQYDKGQYQAAIETWKQAILIFETRKDASNKVLGLTNIGLAYYGQANYQQSIQYFSQALSIYQAQGDRNGEASTLSSLGMVYIAQADYGQSLKFYQRARAIYKELKDYESEASTLMHGIARIYNSLGQISRRDEAYEEAIFGFQKVSSEGEKKADILSDIGFAYFYIKKYDQAIQVYQQALVIYESGNNSDEQVKILTRMGLTYTFQRKIDDSINAYERALSVLKSNTSPKEKGDILGSLAYAYEVKANYQKAIDYYKEALKIFQDLDRKHEQAYNLENIGSNYKLKKQIPLAIENYQASLLMYQKIGEQDNVAVLWDKLAQIFKEEEKIEQAISFYKQSVNTYERIRKNITALSRTEQATYSNKISVTYRNLASLLITQNRLTEAQQVLELLKIRELKEIESRETQTPIRQLSIADSEKQDIAQINPGIASEIQSNPLPQPDQFSTINALNQSAQALTKPNSALIYHLITDEKLWIILITPDGKLQRFASSQTKAQLETLTQSIRAQLEKCERSTCTTTDTQTLNQTTQTLYEQLFPADLKTALAQTKHLTFALDGSLRNIPIAALYTGQQYLIEKYTLSSIIAAQLTDSQDKIPRNAQDSPILALGTSQSARLEVPEFIKADRQDRFAGLANVPIELNAILRSDRNPKAFPGKQLLNDQFTLPNIQQQLPKHRILHIASHGIFRPNSLDYSYILLGNQKRWSIAALDQDAQLFQNLHLITLSACQTGLSDRDKNGMEIAGMSHAFLSKGAKAINASLWSIDDASTAILMQQFYQNLTQNQSKAQALQTAQLHLLRTPRSQLITELSRSTDTRWTFESPNTPTPSTPVKTRDYSHPYYWAAFTLIGNSL
jgi:CHAT domain-containing protein